MTITELFTDRMLVAKIQRRLPELFYLAELESSRAGKVGMEVGSVREKILIALLLYKFGEQNVQTDLPIHEPEADVKVFGRPLSIKTMTGATFKSVKLIWTVDAEQAIEFSHRYIPSCDMLLVQVNWNNTGGVFLFSQETQIEILEKMGRAGYIKLPKAGTNPRGVEVSGQALDVLSKHPHTLKFPVQWYRTKIEYNPYQRWLDLWQEE
ncbi:MAG TPA: ThaI family type II restriction endonuclease [Anaerolineales bacterium]|nr:ThaI family type II restriction endonuclease [Anaerolineales bacterium]